MLYLHFINTHMKKYHITKYIAVAATVEAAHADEAVNKFEANLDASINYEDAYKHDLVFGSSSQHDTVEEVTQVEFKQGRSYSKFTLVGHIAGGEFIPSKDFPDA